MVHASLVDIGRQVNRGLAWVGAAQSVVSLLDVVSILLILRFWVSQEEYGQVMLAYSLFPMLDIIGDLGIGAAVVGREQTRAQLSTLFWLNVLLILGVFLVLCGIAPLIALLHGVPVVGWMIVAWGGKLVFQSTFIIPLNLMRRELRFAELSAIRVVANLVEAVAKVAFAWAGFHLWCFVLGGLSRQLVTAAGVRWRNPWRPSLVWKPREAWESIKFGMRTSASEFLYYFYSSLDVHVVSLFFGKAAVGVYSTASQLVLMPVKILSGVVGEVAFPSFARLRHEGDALIDQLVRFTRLNLAIVLPYVALIALVCADFTAVVVPGWTAAVPAIRILCLVGVLRSLSAIGPPLFYGIGKAGLVLRYMVVAAITLPAMFALGAVALRPLGFISVAISWVVGYPIAFAVLVALTVGELHLSLRNFAARIWGVAACTPLAAVPALGATLLLDHIAPLLRLAATAVVFLTGLALLLARWQGMGARAVAQSLKR